MIRFDRRDNDKQYVMITVADDTLASDVFRVLADEFPAISDTLRALDNRHILFEVVDDVRYGFSLRELANSTSLLCEADVYSFAVDKSEYGEYNEVYRHAVTA